MLDIPAAAVINHLLDREAFARERLRPFAGRAVRFILPPLPDLTLAVLDSGLVETAPADEPALEVAVPLGALPRLLRHDEAALGEVRISGDGEFATTIQYLFRNLRWDAEEDLARLVGDAAAYRIAGTGRALLAWQRDASGRFGENVAEYLKEESGMLPRPADVAQFAREVAELRDATERLEKRIGRLARGTERS